MKHEGAVTSFQRLDGEILGLRKRIALSALYSWNYQSWYFERMRHTPKDSDGDDLPERSWCWPELLSLVLALVCALCACGPQPGDEDAIPEIAGPCLGPLTQPQLQTVGRVRLQDDSTLFIVLVPSID